MMRTIEMTMIVGVILALLGLGLVGGPTPRDGAGLQEEPVPTSGPAPSHGLAWND
ncbi:MAG: hypothetical protein OEM62_11195 [Acidobacteriota bacterium]|nr:hypothetical protein [Acidobacteriota bacterium]